MLRAWIRRRQLVAFLLVTFGWTWSWDGVFFALGVWDSIPVSIPRVWGPVVATVVVVWASETSLRSWVTSVLDWRVRPGLYVLALGIPLFVSNVQPVVRAVSGGSVGYSPPAPFHLMVLGFLVVTFVLGGTEEVGWRGFLQPELQRRTSVLTAGLAIGVLWWAWHLPLFLTGDPNYSLDPWAFVTYTSFVIGASAVFGAVVNLSNGKVLPLMVMHGAVNMGAFLSGTGGRFDDTVLVSLLVGSGLWWAIAGGLVIRYGPAMLPESMVGTADELRSGDPVET